MVLVDTSIWVDHLKKGSPELIELLETDKVLCHPFIIGELACGNLHNRKEILELLQSLPEASKLDDFEYLHLIEKQHLWGKGIGFVDIHLLGAALFADAKILTLDTKLKQQAHRLGIAY